MSYQNGIYKCALGLKVRPIHELRTCLVYTPANPRLWHLNLNMWLIFELAQEVDRDHLAEAYAAAVGPDLAQTETAAKLDDGLAMLEQNRLLEFVPY